ncbi:MAG: UDP-3-O-(3-hydroxymyristoyl)glucosamine N-acyltransferase [Gemmatimonadetes bacterium]|nr:UDP-3-O-(3-hydroxymyristoyl)glucosamine N-acyltransferase [Gemmatimonadota bacterium]NIW36889.1 UDP-3-O-(3-hydroxymyristoyl)glucosamine N-acyltransferase [Gemmatimonadota bacterium]
MSRDLKLSELARRLDAELVGDGERTVSGAAPIETAGPEEVSFLARRKYLQYLPTTRAAAVIVGRDLGEVEPPRGLALLWVDDAHLALADTLSWLYPEEEPEPGVAPTATLGPGVEIGEDVSIGHYVAIGGGVKLGDRVRIGPHCSVGDRSQIGAETELRSQVALYPDTIVGERCILHSGARIGVDGYGYVFTDGGHRKIPQVGRCVIEDDVEIGANSCIDRGSVGETRIGAGSKIDNLVHVAHNVRIGRNCIIVAQVGIAGSTEIGNGVALAGQVGIIGHLSIGDGARVAAQAGVTQDIPAGETWFGHPARPHTRVMRANAAFLKLPELIQRVRRIEKQLGPVGADDD